jgi:copper chaperone CopZ
MIDQLQKNNCQIVHAIAGRIRIKVPRLKTDTNYAEKLQQAVKSLGAVTDVRINSANASMIVEYNSTETEKKPIQTELVSCIQKADNIRTGVSFSPESPKSIAEKIEKHDLVKAVSPDVEQPENDISRLMSKSLGIQMPEDSLTKIDQFPFNIDLPRKVFEIGIPAPYILQPLNAELDKFEAENEQNTDLQQIKVNFEAFFKEGGLLIKGKANGKFRETLIVNPVTHKKYYSPWISITAVGSAALDVSVADETISVSLSKLSVSGASGKWYKKLVKYAFEYIFKNKIVARINDALSKINGAKIQQLFFELKGDEKLRKSAQELGLTEEKLDELLKLVEVNARVSSEHLWLYVQL